MMTSSMRCECDESTMMSCLCHPHANNNDVGSYNTNTNDVMHLSTTWHEWNVNAGDIMVTWFAHDANLVMSHWACASRAREHGACATIKMDMSKYPNGLTGTPADSNIGKITATHFKALITQNANKNMPDMFPIVYLNENLRYCNEN